MKALGNFGCGTGLSRLNEREVFQSGGNNAGFWGVGYSLAAVSVTFEGFDLLLATSFARLRSLNFVPEGLLVQV